MKANVKASETAQILILFVIGLVGLLGFAALAIDGSMIYSDRRYDQSVADAAALAGAAAASQYMNANDIVYETFDCPLSNLMLIATNGAKSRVLDNNMPPLADGLSSGHGVLVECISSDLGGYLDRYLRITVTISSETKTSFAHIVTGHDNIRNTVIAEVTLRPPTNVGFGYGIASLGTTCTDSQAGGADDGIEFAGTADTIIHDSGIFSNSCLRGNGTISVSALPNDETGVYSQVPAATIGGAAIQPNPLTTSDLIPREPVYPEPDCSQVPDRGVFSHNGGTHTIQPGRYEKINIGNNASVTMSPGLYCVYGTANNDGFQVSGSVWGENVEIFMDEGKFDSGGGTSVYLAAALTDDYLPAQKGMVIYMDADNTDGIDMRGGSTTTFIGTVYAPYATIDAGGNSETEGAPTLRAQFIGNQVILHGVPGMMVYYDSDLMAEWPTSLSMTQ